MIVKEFEENSFSLTDMSKMIKELWHSGLTREDIYFTIGTEIAKHLELLIGMNFSYTSNPHGLSRALLPGEIDRIWGVKVLLNSSPEFACRVKLDVIYDMQNFFDDLNHELKFTASKQKMSDWCIMEESL